MQSAYVGSLVTMLVLHVTHWLQIIVEKHYQRALWETCDPWDMLSEWWGDMTWQTKRQRQRQRHKQNNNDKNKYNEKYKDKDI